MSLLSVKDVAAKYGFSDSQIRRLIRQGLIKAHKLGSYYAIDERCVKSLKKRRSDSGVKKNKDE